MNLKHLRYFWTVGHAGSVSRAAQQLRLTPQTVSAQLKVFEQDCGADLLRPAGRGLELTEAGRVALSYADEIFALGDEMANALRTHAEHALPALRVGVADVVPKSLAFRLLAPLGALPEPVRLVCREGSIDWLLAELALHRLDMVVADRGLPPGIAVRAHNHKLGDSAVAFLGSARLAERCGQFPQCLDGLPLLLPGHGAAVRGDIDRWLADRRVSPQLVGEFDDSALMKAFAQAGHGAFPAPAILSAEICARYRVVEIGRTEALREAFWLISPERRVRHPAVRAVLDAARAALFSPSC